MIEPNKIELHNLDIELQIRNKTIDEVIYFIQNNYKNNIYWKWACNDIADALLTLKNASPTEK